MSPVDWGLAARIAKLVASDTGPSARPAGLDAVAAAARGHVEAATGLRAEGGIPPVEWVGRGTWIEANLQSMRTTLGPALERSTAKASPALQSATSAVLAAELGGLLGMLSRRVMGQYDLNLVDPTAPTRLLLVAPNLDHAARELAVDHEELVTWVTLHEVTHAVQFGAVDWLRPHLGALLEQLLSLVDVKLDARALLRLDLADLRGLVDRVRQGGLVLAMVGPERQAAIDGVQTTMALVEGHAEWTMDRAGREVLPDVDALRAALGRRRADRSPVLRILDRLLGFELKLRQYELGRSFCDSVVAVRGDAGLVEAWSSLERSPTSAELAEPARWLARTRSAAA